MIKLFRKIRQDLITQNKTTRYFKYAIGEIILVVIGILIALQINNWNQNRLARIEEKTVLSNLKEDFQSAVEEFKFLNILRNDIISAGKEIYEMNPIDIEKHPITYLDSLFFKTMSAPTFNNQSGSLNVLLTSGKINLISNQNLKEQLIEWPGDVADMTEDEVNHSALYTLKFSNILDKYISWNDIFKQHYQRTVRFNSSSIESLKKNAKITSDYKLILEDKIFLNTLNRRIVYCQLTNGETDVLINKARGIIKLIDNELSND